MTRGIGPGSKRTWTPEQAKAWAAEHAEGKGVPKSTIARREGCSPDTIGYAIRCATGQHKPAPSYGTGNKTAGASPRELAVQLAAIDCARIARGDEPLIDGRTFRRAQTVSAGLSGRGLVHEVESALMYLESRGLVHGERPDATVSPCRPQRYRWSSPRWLEMAQRFVRLETARGLGDVAVAP